MQPTRTTDPETGWACTHVIPIRSCSRWGLPCRSRCRSRGGLLHHLFTLTPAHRGGSISVALSLRSPSPGVTRHRVSVEPGLSSRTGFRPLSARSSNRLAGSRVACPRRKVKVSFYSASIAGGPPALVLPLRFRLSGGCAPERLASRGAAWRRKPRSAASVLFGLSRRRASGTWLLLRAAPLGAGSRQRRLQFYLASAAGAPPALGFRCARRRLAPAARGGSRVTRRKW